MTNHKIGPRPVSSPPAFIASGMGANGGVRISAIQAARSIGSLDLSPNKEGTIELTNLKVAPEFRRQGLATRLMDAAVQRARRDGVARILLEAHPSDRSIQPAALQNAYQKMGFNIVGRSSR